MSFISLTEEEVIAGKPVKTSVMDKIRANLDDLDSRVSSQSQLFILVNEIINPNEAPIGTLQWSDLDESSFQTAFGDGWDLIEDNLHFLMNKGSASADEESTSIDSGDTLDPRTKLPNSNFTTDNPGDHTHGIYSSGGTLASGIPSPATTGNVGTSTMGGGSHSHNVTGGGDSVSRPKTRVAYLYRKNRANTYSERYIFRASAGITLTTAKITQMVAGTAGVSSLDVQIGSSLSSLATIFSTKPSVAYSVGDKATSSNAVFSQAAVSINDWVVVSLDSAQTGCNSKIHIQLEGEST